MDLTKEELRIYMGTLGGLLKLINNMESPSVKKIRQLLEIDLNKMKDVVEKQMEVH